MGKFHPLRLESFTRVKAFRALARGAETITPPRKRVNPFAGGRFGAEGLKRLRARLECKALVRDAKAFAGGSRLVQCRGQQKVDYGPLAHHSLNV